MNSEDNAVPTSKRHNHRSRLHARPLLRHHKLAPCKVLTGFRQQYRELKRKHVLAVQVLMQAIVIVGPIPKQQRCRLDLTCLMTPFDEVDKVLRITDVDTHGFIPTVRDRNKPRIEDRPKIRNETRERVRKYLYSPRPKPCLAITT